MQDLKYDTSWEESLESEDFKRSLTADLVFEAVRRRIELGLSQKDLADKINSTQSVISRFENLGRQPSINFLERVAKALCMQFSATLNGEYMYVVPYRLQPFVKQSSEAQEGSVKEYLTDTVTKYLSNCSRDTWKVINSHRMELKDLIICQADENVYRSSTWILTKYVENDNPEDTVVPEDLQILAEM